MNQSMKEKIVLFAVCMIALALPVLAVCVFVAYFLDSEFVTTDAAPLTSPYITSGGQSITVTETDGSFAVTSGELVVTAQSSPVENDQVLRYGTDTPDYLGRTMVFKLIPTTNGAGTGVTWGFPATLIGWTDSTGGFFNPITDYGIGWNSSRFLMYSHERSTADSCFFTMPFYTPSTSDTFYFAITMGGTWNFKSQMNLRTWYTGQPKSTYGSGNMVFVKKGIAGAWLIVGQSVYGTTSGETRNGVISNYNNAFKLDDWKIRNDTLAAAILNPAFYSSFKGTAGRLFSDAVEVGTAMDSVRGSWVIADVTGPDTVFNCISPSGTNPGAPINWITTETTSYDDIYALGQTLGHSQTHGWVFRYKTSDDSHILFQYAEGAPDNWRIFTYSGGSYTQRALDNTGIVHPATGNAGYVQIWVYDLGGNTVMEGTFTESSGETHYVKYTHSGLFNSGETKHGFRGSNTTEYYGPIVYRAIGTGNEYDVDLNCIFSGADAEMEARGNNVVITDGDASPSASDSTDFGGVLTTGATRKVTFKVKNTGEQALTLSGTPKVAVAGTHAADFTVTTQPSSPVAGLDSTTFVVEFDPSATGTRSATLSIANTDADENPYNWSIQGMGITREILVKGNDMEITSGDVSASAADFTSFGTITKGTVSRTFKILNTGTSNLTLSGNPKVALSGSSFFSVTTQPSSPVAGGDSTTTVILFTPTRAGTFSATVSIANDDSDENPYTFLIQGTMALLLGADFTRYDSISVTLVGAGAKDTVWVVPSINGKMHPLNQSIAVQTSRTTSFAKATNLWFVRTSGSSNTFRIYALPINPLNGALSKNDSTYVLGSSGAAASLVSGSNYSLSTDSERGFGLVLSQVSSGTNVIRIIVETSQ